MSKNKAFPYALKLVAKASLLTANVSTYACPPWSFYQPKMPKALIKKD